MRGFTLVEILVATAVLVLLAGMVALITFQVLGIWTRSTGKLSANAEARVAINLLGQDLETAFFRNDGLQWLRVEAVDAGTGGPYVGETVALKFFTPALDRDPDEPGELCAVAYRLAYKESYENGPDVYALYRALAQPRTTFNDLMGSRENAPDPQASLDENSDGAPEFWDATEIEKDENFLASNIVGFRILVFPEGDPDAANNDLDGKLINYAFGGEDGTNAPLRMAEISLTVISDEGLKILGNLAAGRAGTGYTNGDAVVREHSETYIRWVAFLGRPL